MQQTWVQALDWKCPLEKEMATILVFSPGKSHGQRSLEGCSTWGHRVRHNLSEHEHEPALAPNLLMSPWSKTHTHTHTHILGRTLISGSSYICMMGLIFFAVENEELMWEKQHMRTTVQGTVCDQTPLAASYHTCTHTLGAWELSGLCVFAVLKWFNSVLLWLS